MGGPVALAAATAAIPLAPEDEDLRLPLRPQAPAASPQQAPPVQSAVPPAASPQSAQSLRSEELSRREFELNRREKDLATREAALKSLEGDVNSLIRTSDQSKAEISELIARNQAILDEQKALRDQRDKEEAVLKEARVEHLVAAFKGMKPEQAGALMNSMDDAVAVAILSAMPGSNAGKILANVTPDKAARLVKSISEQKVDPKVLLESGGAGADGGAPPPAM
ncbi:MAG: hypothetical protein LBE49_04050 [Deltaproteobacteria bacterium]|nr:hypothetical protein [Deltaproteobacteria bacterium]